MREGSFTRGCRVGMSLTRGSSLSARLTANRGRHEWVPTIWLRNVWLKPRLISANSNFEQTTCPQPERTECRFESQAKKRLRAIRFSRSLPTLNCDITHCKSVCPKKLGLFHTRVLLIINHDQVSKQWKTEEYVSCFGALKRCFQLLVFSWQCISSKIWKRWRQPP